MSILPLLDPDTAAQVRKTVVHRLAAGKHDGALLNGKTILDPGFRIVAKFALIEIRSLNPCEELSEAEIALLRGISLDTLQREKSSEKLAVLNAKAKTPQQTRR